MFSILPTEAWNVLKFSPWLIIRVEELTSWLLCRTNSVLGCEFTSMRIRFVGVISLGFVQISYESKPEWGWRNKTSLNMMYLMCLDSLIWIDKLHLRSCSVLRPYPNFLRKSRNVITNYLSKIIALCVQHQGFSVIK